MGLLVLFAFAYVVMLVVATWGLMYRIAHPPRHGYAKALAKGWPGEPSAVGLSFVELRLEHANGKRTLGWLIDGDAPTGPLLIITHGWADSRWKYVPLANLLAPMCSKMLLYDMRGHGDSEAPVCHCDRPEAADVRGFIQQLRQRDDVADGAPAVLLGMSMGAGISIRATAGDEAGVIAGVIGDGAYRHRWTPVAEFLRCKGWPSQPMCWLAGQFARIHGRESTYDRAALAAELRVPLLLLHGELDGMCTVEHAEAIAAAATNGRLVAFADCHHLDLFERDAQRYVGTIRTFLDALPLTETDSGQP